MRTILVFTVFTLLGVAGTQYYQDFSSQHVAQTYYNSRYGYKVLYPAEWQTNAQNQPTSTADTVYFFTDPVVTLPEIQAIPPRGSHYISVAMLPNLQHLYPSDWYKQQLSEDSFQSFGVTSSEQITTVFDREAYRLSRYQSGKLIREDFLIDDGNSILQVSLIPSPSDSRPIPEQEFSAMVGSLSFDPLSKKN